MHTQVCLPEATRYHMKNVSWQNLIFQLKFKNDAWDIKRGAYATCAETIFGKCGWDKKPAAAVRGSEAGAGMTDNK